MSDVDEGDREGDRAYGGDGKDHPIHAHIRSALRQDDPKDAIWWLTEALQALLASHQELEDRLETYIKRSAPAMSAARMRVPIGGGDYFWRRQEARRMAERDAKRRELLAELDKNKEQLCEDFSTLFKDPEAVTSKPKVQRKRTRRVRGKK